MIRWESALPIQPSRNCRSQTRRGLAEGGRVERHIETFATTTSDLERLSAWLAGHGVTHVAMEATGVYWKPVWAVRGGLCARAGQRPPRQGRAGAQDGRERCDL